MINLKIDPEFQSQIPPLTDDEFHLAIRAFGGYDDETLQIFRHHRRVCR